jgi:hypothetical protein
MTHAVAPSGGLDAPGVQHGRHLLDEVGRHLFLGQVFRLHQRLAGLGVLPRPGGLVGTDMIDFQRRAGGAVIVGDRVDHLPDEGIGRGDADVQCVVVIVLDRVIDRGVFRVDQPVARGLLRLALGDQPAGAGFHRPDGST